MSTKWSLLVCDLDGSEAHVYTELFDDDNVHVDFDSGDVHETWAIPWPMWRAFRRVLPPDDCPEAHIDFDQRERLEAKDGTEPN